MAKLHKLTARMVALASKPGRLSDGGNLYLAVSRSGAKSWTFFYEKGGRQREAGLGSAAAVTLAEARAKASELRKMLASGVDPLDAKQLPASVVPTFGEVAVNLIASKRSGWRSLKHQRQWQTTLETYCASLWPKPVDAVDVAAVLAVLTPHWTRVPETAQRLRGRIEAVLDAAEVRGFRSGKNPAQWRGQLVHLLSRPSSLERPHHAAMPYTDVPQFVAKLRALGTAAALALELLLLTACRSGEVLGADWSEVDLPEQLWSIPPARTKTGRGHQVPLPRRAVEIFEQLGQAKSGPVFPKLPKLRDLLSKGVTVHGFRSSFRDWCGEETLAASEIAEGCLGHVVGSAVERSYRRGSALEKRRGLLQQWADYCEGTPADNVVSIGARKG